MISNGKRKISARDWAKLVLLKLNYKSILRKFNERKSLEKMNNKEIKECYRYLKIEIREIVAITRSTIIRDHLLENFDRIRWLIKTIREDGIMGPQDTQYEKELDNEILDSISMTEISPDLEMMIPENKYRG